MPKTPTRNVQEPPTVTQDVGIELLKKQKLRGEALLANRPLLDDTYSSWQNTTREFLTKAFGKGSPTVFNIMRVGLVVVSSMDESERDRETQRVYDLRKQLTLLDGAIDQLATEIEIQSKTAPAKNGSPLANAVSNERVFIVHGRADGPRESVARFLDKLGLVPIILHEQPNGGRTIIEKFTDNADVGFAVVLMTADDKGGSTSAADIELRPRARQNVILELGFFLGRLGRSRVCALYQKGVEIPSDYNGVLFVELDSAGAWQWQLGRELRAVGYPIDLNNAV